MDADVARRRLEELLADLDRSQQTLVGEHAGESGELTVIDQHQADAATDLVDQDREGAVLEVVQRQRTEVLAALERLDAGTYGRCVDCGTTLPEERLDVRPEAARCVHCQAKVEAALR